MDQTIRRTVGNSEGLFFDLRLVPTGDEREALAWGELRADLAGEPVWYEESEEGEIGPICWTWADLLEFLGKKWIGLTLEENYPFPVFPLHPGRLRQEMEKRWESMPEEMVDEEGERLFTFEGSHDLARGLKGIFLPSIFVLRQGTQAWVCTSEQQILRPFDSIREDMEELGEFLAKHLESADHPRANYAVCCWRNREADKESSFLFFRTGLKDDIRKVLEEAEPPEKYWELASADVDGDNEILAAARLSAGIVSPQDQKSILARIKTAGRGDTGRLDDISRRLRGDVDFTGRPYDQGYALALALARYADIPSERPQDLERLLSDLGVEILELKLEKNCPVDAVAAWGVRHGPVIVLNTERRPAHVHGRRTTLAHELCHLLIDRQGFLPFSEVLGGATPVYAEQRAGAFAAEFLLPRKSASEYVRRLDSVGFALDALSGDFQVSKEMAALQLRNSHAYMGLDDEEKNLISRITGVNDSSRFLFAA